MESIIVTIFCVALIIFAALTVANGALSTTDDAASAWKSMEDTAGAISRTNLTGISGVTSDGTIVDVTLGNDGETKLEDFDEWDVMLRYWEMSGTPAYQLTRLAYNSGTPGALGNNEWTVKGIYLNAGSGTAEVFDPGILNPDEDIKIEMKVSPAVGTPNANLAVISAPNGVSASVTFTR